MHDVPHFMRPDGRDYERSSCPILTANRDGTVVRVRDDTFIRRDGSQLPVAYTASPLQSSQGEMGCVVVFMDATSIRSEERRLKAEVDKLSWIRGVQDAVAEDRSRHVVQAIVNLARGFGLQTVAEGVEDPAALEVLAELGIDMAQGFYLGRPAALPALDIVPGARDDQEQQR